MNPKKSSDFDKSMEGEEAFEGIGAEIGIKKGVLTIVAPLPDMPADQAGLKPGDSILAINGESTSDISIDEAVDRIRGERGTTVTLSIARESWDEIRDIEVTRDNIVVHSVRPDIRDDGIMVIRITDFNNDTEKSFNDAIHQALENNAKGIVLDLRSNPGGYLDTAIEVASEWLDNKVVVTEKYNENKKIEHLSRGRARLIDMPTVVLVNRGSASASEIVSGALQDHHEAVVVGEQTFGKGSVQRLVNLDDGSSIKITVAKWLTPDGRSINDEGITPDIEIEYTEEDYNNNVDPQMDKAINLLQMQTDDITRMIGTSTKETATSTE
jgi:carboxyl-terminal processing protease